MTRALAMCVCLLLPATAVAQGLIANFDGDRSHDASGPTLQRLQSLTVQAAMTDTVGTTTEIREYRIVSYSFQILDGVARFYRPLAADASVVSLTIGGEPRAWKILEPSDANLLRLELAGSLREPVFLREWGTRLLVSQELIVEAGAFQPPLQITLELEQPHEARGTMRGVTVPVDWHREPAGHVSVEVSVKTETPLRALYSPYHTLSLERQDTGHMIGKYQGVQRCTAFGVTLLFSTGTDAVHLDLLPYRDPSSEGTFLALLSTSGGTDEGQVIARDIVLVLDRSGSMSGEKMTQARAALDSVLVGLRPEDHVAIVAFDGAVDTFTDQAVPSSAANVADARAFVQALNADGGTNIADALKTAFSMIQTHTGRPHYVVFLTDGVATEGETDTDAILEMARAFNEVGARIFTFGIGHDVNTVLLDSLALESAGDALYIQPGQAVDTAVAAFFDQIADPVLTNPTLDTSESGGTMIYPQTLNDLYANSTVVLAGRFDRPGPGRITIHGTIDGRPVRHDFDVVLPSHAPLNGFVPRVWARRRVADLLQQIKLGDKNPALETEALALARRYGVVTDFTFFELTVRGDMVMMWGGVPDDKVGSTAVETSASIDSYGKATGVSGATDSQVRYDGDRTFPTVQGWFTDTATLDNTEWTDVHFMSELYLELVRAEAALGVTGRLSVDANTRFEFLGRHIRVTDTTSMEDAPSESASIPNPADVPSDTDTSVVAGTAPEGAAPEGAAPEGAAIPNQEPRGHGVPLPGQQVLTVDPAPAGCTVTANPSSQTSHTALWLVMIIAVLGTVRLRRNEAAG